MLRKLRRAAEELYEELDSARLVVAKVNGHPRPQRLAIETNARWYRDFCAAYMRRRRRYPRPRTIIRRSTTLRALERLAGGDARGVYAERLMPFLELRASRRRRRPTAVERRESRRIAAVEF